MQVVFIQTMSSLPSLCGAARSTQYPDLSQDLLYWNSQCERLSWCEQVGGGSVEGGLAAVQTNDQAMRELVTVLDVDSKVWPNRTLVPARGRRIGDVGRSSDAVKACLHLHTLSKLVHALLA